MGFHTPEARESEDKSRSFPKHQSEETSNVRKSDGEILWH